MQVFGLPGHIIRSARGASRLSGGADPRISKPPEDVTRWRAWQKRHGARAEQPTGGRSCGRPSVHPLPLAALRADPLEPSATPECAPTPASTRSGRSRRAPAPRFPHVGQGKAPGRSCANRATPHPTPPSGGSSARSSGAERFSFRSRPDPQSRRQSSAKRSATPRHPKTQRALPSKSPATSSRSTPSRSYPLPGVSIKQFPKRLRSDRQMDRRQGRAN